MTLGCQERLGSTATELMHHFFNLLVNLRRYVAMLGPSMRPPARPHSSVLLGDAGTLAAGTPTNPATSATLTNYPHETAVFMRLNGTISMISNNGTTACMTAEWMDTGSGPRRTATQGSGFPTTVFLTARGFQLLGSSCQLIARQSPFSMNPRLDRRRRGESLS